MTRVLVVDDYPDAATSLCQLLSLMGHDARPAYNSSHALALACTFDFDLAIIDLDLGISSPSGFDIARKIRADWPRRLLIAMTGWSREQDRAAAAAAGFDGFVLKPFDMPTLRALFGRRKAAL